MVNIQKPPSGIDPKTYDYLYQLSELLSLYLGNGSSGSAQTPAITSENQVKQQQKDQATLDAEYDAIKSLIIKTADQVTVTRTAGQFNSLNDALNVLNGQVEGLLAFDSSKYVAVSDFGSYLQETNAAIALDPDALNQYYGFVSDLTANLNKLNASFENYRVETEGYIRTGIVYYDGAVPVYGVAVGQDLTTAITADGETEIKQKNFRATYTASKLSFWQDTIEVAYVSNNMLYIPNATVLNSLSVGNWEVTTTDGLKFKWVGG